MKLLIIVYSVLLFSNAVYSQHSYTITFDELPEKLKDAPKPIVIKLYTDWCGVCKIQDKKIEKDKELQKLLADGCYFIEFNAESKKSVLFKNTQYNYIIKGGRNKGYHELAALLTNNSNSYPHWVVISSDYEIIDAYGGLLTNTQLKAMLNTLTQYYK